MKAVILAAGMGTRLGTLTKSVPKILLPVRGVPLLMRQTRYLRDQGVRELAVNAFHHAEQVEHAARNLAVKVFKEETLLGTAGALLPMREWLGDEPFLILYGDTLTDLVLSSLMTRLHPHDQAALACQYMHDVKGKGVLTIDRWTGNALDFIEKPEVGGGGVAFMGVAVLRPDALRLCRIKEGDGLAEDLFPRLAKYGRLRAVVQHRSVRFLDVGTPGALARAW